MSYTTRIRFIKIPIILVALGLCHQLHAQNSAADVTLEKCNLLLINLQRSRASDSVKNATLHRMSELSEELSRSSFREIPEFTEPKDPDIYFNSEATKYLTSLLGKAIREESKNSNSIVSNFLKERFSGLRTTDNLAKIMFRMIQEEIPYFSDLNSASNYAHAIQGVGFKSLKDFVFFGEHASIPLIAKWIRIRLNGPKGDSREIYSPHLIRSALDVSGMDRNFQLKLISSIVKEANTDLKSNDLVRAMIHSAMRGLLLSGKMNSKNQITKALTEIKNSEQLLNSTVRDVLARLRAASLKDEYTHYNLIKLGRSKLKSATDNELINSILIELLASEPRDLAESIFLAELDFSKNARFHPEYKETLSTFTAPLTMKGDVKDIEFTFEENDTSDPQLLGQTFRIVQKQSELKKDANAVHIYRIPKKTETMAPNNHWEEPKNMQRIVPVWTPARLGRGPRQEMNSITVENPRQSIEPQYLMRVDYFYNPKSGANAKLAKHIDNNFGPDIEDSISLQILKKSYAVLESNPEISVQINIPELEVTPHSFVGKFTHPWDTSKQGVVLYSNDKASIWLKESDFLVDKPSDTSFYDGGTLMGARNDLSSKQALILHQAISKILAENVYVNTHIPDLHKLNHKTTLMEKFARFFMNIGSRNYQRLQEESLNAKSQEGIKVSEGINRILTTPFSVNESLQHLLKQLSNAEKNVGEQIETNPNVEVSRDELDILLSSAKENPIVPSEIQKTSLRE